MKEEKFTFLSADNKTTIHGIWWKPEQPPKGVLQIAHGLTEYGQRYEDFAEFLTGYGYAVAVNDVIGHGESVTPGEEPVHIEKWEHTVKDFGTCRRRTEERFGGLPYYMLGFSLGSFILHSYLTEHAQGIQGVILAGTGMIPDFQLKIAKAYVKHIGKKAGMNRKDPRIHDLRILLSVPFRDGICESAPEGIKATGTGPFDFQRPGSGGGFWKRCGKVV